MSFSKLAPRVVMLSKNQMNASNSSQNLWESFKFQRKVYSITIPVLLAYCSLCFLINAGVLCLIPYVKGRWNAVVKLTFSLALTDVFTTAAMSFSLVHNSYLYFVFGIETNACVALTSEAARMGGFFAGLLHLVVLAVNHFVSIRYPFLYPHLLSPSRVKKLIRLMWILPVSCFLLLFSSIPGQAFLSPGGKCQRLAFAYKLEYRVIVTSFILLLMSITVILYIFIYVTLHHVEQRSNSLSGFIVNGAIVTDTSRKFSTAATIAGHQRQENLLNRKRGTLITSLLFAGTFFMGWFPTCLFFILTCDRCVYSFQKRTDSTVYVFGFLSAIFILTKTLLNPIIYAVRIPEIRRVLENAKQKISGDAVAVSGFKFSSPSPPGTTRLTSKTAFLGVTGSKRRRKDKKSAAVVDDVNNNFYSNNDSEGRERDELTDQQRMAPILTLKRTIICDDGNDHVIVNLMTTEPGDVLI
uniref:G-protein coupled receptors family 1 profile domain-containing protein n=1 Tax=Romanomermis culicivorax TaxID=13658 RepID=A0A915JUU7_ROMCU